MPCFRVTDREAGPLPPSLSCVFLSRIAFDEHRCILFGLWQYTKDFSEKEVAASCLRAQSRMQERRKNNYLFTSDRLQMHGMQPQQQYFICQIQTVVFCQGSPNARNYIQFLYLLIFIDTIYRNHGSNGQFLQNNFLSNHIHSLSILYQSHPFMS